MRPGRFAHNHDGQHDLNLAPVLGFLRLQLLTAVLSLFNYLISGRHENELCSIPPTVYFSSQCSDAA